MLEMLILVFVLSASSIALAIVLPIVLWQEEQNRVSMYMAPTNMPRYPILTPTSSFQLSKAPLPQPRKLILQERCYR